MTFLEMQNNKKTQNDLRDMRKDNWNTANTSVIVGLLIGTLSHSLSIADFLTHRYVAFSYQSGATAVATMSV